MNILHVTNHLSRTGGGTPAVIWELARAQAAGNVQVQVLGLRDVHDVSDFPRDCPESLQVRTFPQEGPLWLGWSRELHGELAAGGRSGQADILHQHGLWSLLSCGARRWARRTGRPVVLSAHGMLDAWALRRRNVRKRIFGALVEWRNLRSAKCLHALCDAEARSYRALGLRNPIAVVPGGIRCASFADLPGRAALHARWPEIEGRRCLLFMARLHPKKGLPELLTAWSAVRGLTGEWVLLIAGRDQGGHAEELRALVAQLGIRDRVIFTGEVTGDTKREALGGAEAFVLPSHSEGFPVALLEAAASSLPVLMTTACHFHELAEAGGAWEVEPGAAPLERGLRDLLAASDDVREKMGFAAHALVSRNYTWENAAVRLGEVYTWLAGGAAPPDWVER